MKITRIRVIASTLMAFAIIAAVVFSAALTGRSSQVARAASQDGTALDWNLHALNAFMNPPGAPIPGAGLPPPIAVLHVAMAQGAVYDAVVMIDGGYTPYNSGLPAADAGASRAAAVATAAHRVIVGVVIQPALAQGIVDRIDLLWDEAIAEATVADGPDAVEDGIAAGEAAAAAMLDARANDGRFVPFVLDTGTGPGEWRPTPPNHISDPFAWLGRVDPFVIESTSQFRSKGPRALHTGIYAKEYNEVMTLGGPSAGSARTAEQEAVAQFFLANPVDMFGRAFRDIAAEEGLTTVEQARFLAMLHMAGADAAINCVDDKIHWSFWRPITAIHNGDNDRNRQTVGDPSWEPMVPTPPYSEHASGYNCLTGAYMQVAGDVFGMGRVDLTLVKITPNQPDVTREYKRFADVVKETIDARIYQGLHFRTADVQGAKIGKDVARWLDKHYFRPVN